MSCGALGRPAPHRVGSPGALLHPRLWFVCMHERWGSSLVLRAVEAVTLRWDRVSRKGRCVCSVGASGAQNSQEPPRQTLGGLSGRSCWG